MGGDAPAIPPGESTQEMLSAYVKAFPELLNVTNAGAVPAAQSQLAASQAVSPGLAKLQDELYAAYGPSLARTANTISNEQAMNQAGSDLAVLKGPGGELISQARAVQQQEDPEFYKTRSAVSDKLGGLFDSIDLSGKLSGGEREELTRAVNRGNQSRGIAANPSQTAVVENAMTFGNAGYQRKSAAQDKLGQALSIGTGFLPASRTGVDAFQVGTGRSSGMNAGDSKFTGVDTSLGSGAQGLGTSLLGQIGGLTQQRNDINANRRDSLDRFNQSWGSIVGSL